jgi:membrane protein implicated in regulation of membrane protease activity
MGVLILILLIVLLAAAGVLGFVVKVALGVALGLVAAFALLAWTMKRRIQRALWGPPPRRSRRVRGSRVEVLDRRHEV